MHAFFIKLIFFYNLRSHCLFKLIVKCMQPLSIVESEDFKEFVVTLDPSFTMPNR